MNKLLTSKEMLKTDAKPGYWWVNVAPLGEPPMWRQEVAPHESGLLFGYEPTELMAKQYKRASQVVNT